MKQVLKRLDRWREESQGEGELRQVSRKGKKGKGREVKGDAGNGVEGQGKMRQGRERRGKTRGGEEGREGESG